jgi:hypothetical protein
MSIRKGVALAGLALVAVLVAVPVAISASGDDQPSERAYVFRTLQDPSIDPIPPDRCPGGPGTLFNANGYAYSIATRASDGMVVQEHPKRVGVVRSCTRITSIAEGATAPGYVEIQIGGDTYTGSGVVRTTSVDVPKAGVVLAGSAVRLQTGPDGFVGGIATSASVVLLGPVPGFHTGSFWTLRVYSSD